MPRRITPEQAVATPQTTETLIQRAVQTVRVDTELRAKQEDPLAMIRDPCTRDITYIVPRKPRLAVSALPAALLQAAGVPVRPRFGI